MSNEKKIFVEPACEVTSFDVTDITTSDWGAGGFPTGG